MAPPPSLEDLINDVVEESADDPLSRLRAAAALTHAIDEVTDAALGYFVDQARRSGHSWSEIGESLGVSKQAAQQRQTARTTTAITPITFERFTPRARSVMARSEAIARELGHDYVGTEHVLVAQFSEPEGIGAQILTESGLSARGVRKAVLGDVGRGPGAPEGRLAFTPKALEAFSGALAVALELGHNYIGTEHLLLGVRRTEGVAARILEGAGLDEHDLRTRVEAKLKGRGAARTAPPPAGSAPPARAKRSAGSSRAG